VVGSPQRSRPHFPTNTQACMMHARDSGGVAEWRSEVKRQHRLMDVHYSLTHSLTHSLTRCCVHVWRHHQQGAEAGRGRGRGPWSGSDRAREWRSEWRSDGELLPPGLLPPRTRLGESPYHSLPHSRTHSRTGNITKS
jgi:hypothetical protein